MTPVECEFEADVLAATLQGRWPARVDAELRAHVAGCIICSDVAAIACAIEQNRESISAAAVIPDSGRVWWMAQLRARREAAEAANRPMTIALMAAVVCAAAVLGACSRVVFDWMHGAFGRIASSLSAIDLAAAFATAGKLMAEHGALALAMGIVVVLLPAAVYMLMTRE